MASDDCLKIIEGYLQYLSLNFHAERQSNGCVITTPFLRSDNDPLQFYIEKKIDGRYFITDFGDTIAELELLCLDVFSGKKRELLDKKIQRYNVVLDDTSLEINVEKEDLPDAIHRFIQVMEDICHMENMIRSREILDFNKVVHEYLLNKSIDHDYFEHNSVPIHYRGQEVPVDIRIPVEKSPLGILMRTYHVEEKNQAMGQVKSKVTSFYYLKVMNAHYKGLSVVDLENEMFTPASRNHISASSDYVIDWKDKNDIPKIISECREELSR